MSEGERTQTEESKMPVYGTVIEEDENASALSTARAVKKHTGITVYNQTVVDAKGRRRFHGAFTGFVLLFLLLLFCFDLLIYSFVVVVGVVG